MKIVCPLCKKVLPDVSPDYESRPFCSMRCKLADLGNWMNETYRISRPLTAEDIDDEFPLH